MPDANAHLCKLLYVDGAHFTLHIQFVLFHLGFVDHLEFLYVSSTTATNRVQSYTYCVYVKLMLKQQSSLARNTSVESIKNVKVKETVNAA